MTFSIAIDYRQCNFASIDIAVAQSYVASFERGNLTAIRVMTPRSLFVPVIVEKPQRYDHRTNIAKRRDIEDLARVARAWQATNPGCEARYPREWKGQVPKPVTMRRVRRALSAVEMAVLKRAIQTYPKISPDNFFDAVGLGLWRLERYR
jgi:hypothetical protein